MARRLTVDIRLGDAPSWQENKHPRGQPENKGEFAKGGSGATAKAPAKASAVPSTPEYWSMTPREFDKASGVEVYRAKDARILRSLNEVRGAVMTIPKSHRQVLGNNGEHFVPITVQKEIDPAYWQNHPLLQGMAAAGMFFPQADSAGRIEIAESVRLPDGSNAYLDSWEQTALHEIGHALDHYIAPLGQQVRVDGSGNAMLRERFTSDAAQLADDEKQRAAYWLQTPGEMWAETYAMVFNTSPLARAFNLPIERARAVFFNSAEGLWHVLAQNGMGGGKPEWLLAREKKEQA